VPEQPFPDLPLDICGKIGDACVRDLLADAAVLGTVLGNRIYDVELERLAVDKAGTYQANTLLVAPGPVTEERTANAGYTTVLTAIDFILLSQAMTSEGTQRWLRARIFRRIKRVLLAEDGVLRDTSVSPPGNRLTEALQRFQRLDFNGRLRGDSNLIVTVFRAVFVSDIEEQSGDFIQ
jgi:hypothetical protein